MAVKAAVLSGLAPSVLSSLAVETELSTGSLVEVPVGDVDLTRPLRAVWRRTRPLSAPGQRLLNLLTPGSGTPSTMPALPSPRG